MQFALYFIVKFIYIYVYIASNRQRIYKKSSFFLGFVCVCIALFCKEDSWFNASVLICLHLPPLPQLNFVGNEGLHSVFFLLGLSTCADNPL